MRYDVDKLRELGFTPEQINKVLELNHQRKVVGSNVALNAREQQEALRRFKRKEYFGPAEKPINGRSAAKLEGKYKLNKNLTSKQVEELILAERKFGRVVLSMTPDEVRRLLKESGNA